MHNALLFAARQISCHSEESADDEESVPMNKAPTGWSVLCFLQKSATLNWQIQPSVSYAQIHKGRDAEANQDKESSFCVGQI